MAHHGEPDELYTLRQEFYVGNYQVCFVVGVVGVWKGGRSSITWSDAIACRCCSAPFPTPHASINPPTHPHPPTPTHHRPINPATHPPTPTHTNTHKKAAINEGQGLGRSVAPELEAERAEFVYRCAFLGGGVGVCVWGGG
jgi:hypothetical protein